MSTSSLPDLLKNLPPEQRDAIVDRTLKEQARGRLDVFGRYCFGYTPAHHHRDIIAAIVDPTTDRTVIVVPPSHAKTIWANIIHACWRIGKDPKTHVLIGCNTASQAEDVSMAIRDTVEHNRRFRAVFPDCIPDQARGWAKDKWFVRRDAPGDKDATVTAVGVGGAVVGRRADFIIIDDLNDLENTQTATQLDKVNKWMRAALLSRATPSTRVVGIGTRWAQADAQGVLIDQLKWPLVHFPAIDDEGRALWPEEWPIELLEGKRVELGSAMFQCMYQGDPSVLHGEYFKHQWFQPYEEAPVKELRIFQGWDLAIGKKAENDYTVCATIGIDQRPLEKGQPYDLYLLDIMRKKLTAHYTQEAMEIEARKWHPEQAAIENNAYQEAAVEGARKNVSTKDDLRDILWVPVHTSKDITIRSAVLQRVAESGHFFVPKWKWWWHIVEAELVGLPKAEHDDTVSAIVLALSVYRKPFKRQEPKRLAPVNPFR